MEIFKENLPLPYEGTVVALGNFDGLHIAHMQIIRNGIQYAKKYGLKSGVLLFEQNTKNFTEQSKVELITPNSSKLELLEKEDADFVVMRRFTKEVMAKTPEEFVKFLVEQLNVKAVCCGYDYSFGYQAEGRVDTLRLLCNRYGVTVLVTDKICINGEEVSSTAIRQCIVNGNIEKANKMLGRCFCVEGPVVKGLQNGRKLGFPTANVCYNYEMAIPKDGVYAGFTYVNGIGFKSVINVGKNPTFGADKITIESHVLDYSNDLYGENIRVSFAKRLRGEIKFDSIGELKKQINKDAQTVRAMNL